MAYLTENMLSNVVDLPIALPATDLRMGDWVVVSAIKITAPMRLTYKLAVLQLFASSVDTGLITNGNKIYGNLGLAYLTLRRNYSSGNAGAAGGLDVLTAPSIGLFSRPLNNIVVSVTPGVYSWIVANNMQPSTDATPLIPPSTSIDFRLAVTGSARLELDST